MVEIRIVKRGREIGKSDNHYYIWHACEGCGEERWAVLNGRGVKRHPRSNICLQCAHKKIIRTTTHNPNWKGGKSKTKAGYIVIRLQPDDFFYPMTTIDGRVFEHRLVVAKVLNRCLLPWEVIHHKGDKYPLGSIENKQDNRLENLQLMPCQDSHLPEAIFVRKLHSLQKRNKKLESEIMLLKRKLIEVKNEANNKNSPKFA